MLDQLPIEIVLSILRLAIADDRYSARQLCLVDRATLAIVRPMLYRHVTLDGTDGVKLFNATIKSSPRLGDLIHGVTILDQFLGSMPCDFVDEAMHNEARMADWIKPWSTLIRYLGVLSRHHHLSTLVLSLEAVKRFQYVRGEDEIGVKQPLGEQLTKSNLKLNHLVVSHADLKFILSKIETKKLDWLGCETPFAMKFLDITDADPLRTKDLQEINYYFGDTYKSYQELGMMNGALSSDEAADADQRHRMWIPWFAAQLSRVCEAQSSSPCVSVSCHVKTQGAKRQMERDIGKLSYVKVGVWGNASDTSQKLAEMEMFAANEWIQKEKVARGVFIEEEDAGDEYEAQDETRGEWVIRPPPKYQNCSCFDMKGGPGGDEY